MKTLSYHQLIANYESKIHIYVEYESKATLSKRKFVTNSFHYSFK